MKKAAQSGKRVISKPLMKQGICRHYNIADARTNISRIVAEVANKGECVTIGARNEPSVIMLPMAAPVSPIGNYEYQLACIISEKLLGHAPLHVKRPQIEELSKLSRKQLFVLMEIERFPLSAAVRKKVLKELGDPIIIERIEKRRKIADSILAAKKAGLFEASEHATGMLTFE
jgi:antitoxin (DNA-binding transcriptional repressor) of toxin-antitoxin stability system